MTPKIKKEKERDAELIRAFVQGAKWWQFHKNGSTAFASEVDEMEAKATEMLQNGALGETMEQYMKRHEIVYPEND